MAHEMFHDKAIPWIASRKSSDQNFAKNMYQSHNCSVNIVQVILNQTLVSVIMTKFRINAMAIELVSTNSTWQSFSTLNFCFGIVSDFSQYINPCFSYIEQLFSKRHLSFGSKILT